MDIAAAGCRGHLLQQRFVQPRDDSVPLRILLKGGDTVTVRDRDGFPLAAPDPDRVNPYSARCGCLCHLHRIVGMVLPVGDQHNHLGNLAVGGGTALHRKHGGCSPVDGTGQIRALLADRTGGYIGYEHLRRSIV